MKALYVSFLLLASCSFLISSLEDDYSVVGLQSEKIALLFSHNISGETHPCGCRTFPLGGLPQIAGQMSELTKAGSEIFYVDTGDTFFPTNRLTIGMEKSQKFAAKNLAKGLSQLGLKYHVPGDQDFSAGVDFYGEILKEANLTLLAANLSPNSPIQGQKYIVLERGPHKVFLVGLSDPKLLQPESAKLFTEPFTALENVMSEIKSNGYTKDNPFHRLILLSHSSYEQDEIWAKSFPDFDWIIGSHSQKFTRKPLLEGQTKIVQVLSQNHYLGEVKLNLTASKDKDSFEIHEIHESLGQKLSPNPYDDFIANHKDQMAKLQEQEQQNLGLVHTAKEMAPFNDAKTCIECHQPQSDKWHKTAHSVAYATLLNANEGKNLSCVGCHSLGLSDPRGFNNSLDMTKFEKDDKREAYWQDVQKAFGNVKSIRELPEARVEKLSKQWLSLDQKHGVTRQMANVQCLNCHDKHVDHPFHIDENRPTAKEKSSAMKGKCIACHNADQSPEWYMKKDNGLAGNIDEKILDAKIKAVACPKLEQTGY